jgi:putative lipoprotein (rSAM/lipoprotein system)
MRTHILSRLSLLLGSSIGATNCHEYEYGVPSGTFTISGTVVDAATGLAIPDIEVAYADEEVTTSAQDGSWLIDTHASQVCQSQTCSVLATDVDGDANGSYAWAEARFQAVQTRQDDGSYDQGDWEAADVLVEMEPTHRDTGS